MKPSEGAKRIAAERQRQIEKLGWSEAHDDEHDDESLALAAVCYAAPEPVFVQRRLLRGTAFRDPWPESWSPQYDARLARWPTRKERIRLLEKAGALIAAEIDRLLRKGKR